MSSIHAGSTRNRHAFRNLFKRFLPSFALPAVLALATSVGAIQPDTTSVPILQRAFVAPELQVQPELGATQRLDASTPAAPAVEAFLQQQGGSWEMRWDLRADRPNLIQGSGIALLPGRGNDLTAASLGLSAGEAVGIDLVEARLRGFIERNRDLLKTDGLAFRLDPAGSTPYGDGNSHWFIAFTQERDGVRVDGAQLFFRLSHGNIVQFGSERVAPVTIDTHPASGRDQAFDLAWLELGFGADRWFDCLVAEREGEIAGFALYCRRFEAHTRTKKLYLADLVVAKRCRGEGVGETLVEALRAEASALGCASIAFDLWVENKSARGFYERIGARRDGELEIYAIPAGAR